MELYVTVLTAAVNFLLGTFTLLKNRKSATNRLFFLLTVIIASWATANYFSLHADSPEHTLFWIRAVMVITSPLGPTIYLLVRAFPSPRTGVAVLFKRILFIFTIVLMALAATPLMFSSVNITNGNIVPTPGPAILLFAASFAGGPLISMMTLFYKYRLSRGTKKMQIRFFLFGIVTTFSLMVVTNFLFVVVLRVSGFVIFGPVFSLIFVSFISYSIVKHRFLDIKFVLVRTLAYTILVSLIGLMYIISLFYISHFFTGEKISQFDFFSAFLLATIITITLPILKNILEFGTEKIFYHSRYKTEDLLHLLSQIMASNIILSDLLSSVLRTLIEHMKINEGYIVLKNGHRLYLFEADGQIDLISEENQNNELLRLAFHHRQKSLVLDDLEESKIKNMMRSLDVNVVLPLVIKGELVGGLFISERSSGEAFTNRDINILEILAPQLALAIKNALSYEEIRQFSNTLQMEVERATVKLRRANERLKQLDALKDEFVSVASHELRTPMTAVKSYLWLAMNGKQESVDEVTKGYLTVAYNSTERLIRLVQEMLTISRIEGKHLELHKIMFDFADLVENLYEELKIKAKEKNITFQLNKPKGSLIVEGDTTRLQEVVQNLFSNALKFTPQDGTVTVSLGKQEGFVFLKVQDSGPGILQEDVPKLFQKFSKIERSYVGNSDPGTGLGLFICQQIVKLHQGKIEVESEVGKGSVFTVKLKAKTTTKAKKES